MAKYYADSAQYFAKVLWGFDSILWQSIRGFRLNTLPKCYGDSTQHFAKVLWGFDSILCQSIMAFRVNTLQKYWRISTQYCAQHYSSIQENQLGLCKFQSFHLFSNFDSNDLVFFPFVKFYCLSFQI